MWIVCCSLMCVQAGKCDTAERCRSRCLATACWPLLAHALQHDLLPLPGAAVLAMPAASIKW